MTTRSDSAFPLVGLLLLGIAVYIALSLAMPIPGMFPDEFIYQHLASSVAAGHGFTWRGGGEPLRSALYVYFLLPAWLASSGIDAWHVAKVMSAVASCLVVVPVWLLARTMLPGRLALIPPILCLAGTWMLSSAFLITENIGIPLATAALAATVAAIRRPGSRLPWVAFAFALLGAWARMQLIVLVPVIFAAFAVGIARSGSAWRSQLRLYRWVALAGAAVALLLALAILVKGSSAAGLYSSVLDFRPNIGLALRKTGLELIDLTAQSGYFPVLLAAALLLNRRAWRDEAVGPLLIVFWVAALGFALISGVFLAGVKIVPWGIDRYVAYAVPLVLLLTVVALTRPELVGLRTMVVCGVLSLALLLTPALGDVSEERSVGATVSGVHELFSGASAGMSVFVAALVTCAFVFGSLRLGRRRPAVALAAPVAILLLVLAAQSASAWNRTLGFQRAYRTLFPHDLMWVDHHSDRQVATLAVTGNQLGYEQVEFFNDKVTHYYAAQLNAPGRPLLGLACNWQIEKGGYIKFGSACGTPPSRFLVNDETGYVTFHAESDVAVDPEGGRLVTVSGRPRVQSIVYMPCPPRRILFTRPWGNHLPAPRFENCLQFLRAYLWTDTAATLLVRIKGGDVPHAAQAGAQQFTVPVGRTTTLKIPVKAGGALEQILFDWANRGGGAPEVVGVSLAQGGRTQPLVASSLG